MIKLYYQNRARFVAIVLVLSFITNFTLERIRVRAQMASDANRIYNAVSEPLDYIKNLSINLGKIIADNNKFDDLNYIEKLFRNTAMVQGSGPNILSWAMFNWGDKKNHLTVNTVKGISKNPEDLGERPYVWQASSNKWTFQIFKPDTGRISGMWILPAAVGVGDSHDNFRGMIIVGINLKSLLNRAEMTVDSGNAFVLMNRDQFYQFDDRRIISSSNSPQGSKHYEKISESINKYKDWAGESGSMPSSLKAGKFKFTHYHNIPGYPMVIFVGFNRLEFWRNVLIYTAKATIIVLISCFFAERIVEKKS